MKIQYVNNFSLRNNLNNTNNSRLKQQEVNYYKTGNNYAAMPLTGSYLAQFLPFKGGNSINLAETLKHFKGEYPPDIKEMAEETVRNGNPDDKTLIDIHKEKYGKINHMKSLNEIKAAFPEFEGVLSDQDVDYNKNSFIDDVKSEKLEWFDEETDLAVQLLQMYWADGFSINDLKEYTNGKDIDSVFRKLRIPKLNGTYANVLKLSDKEYNERFTSTMSEKLTGIQRKKAEKRDGVYIPRGPMPEEQKKKISEGLIKHYAEHPEKLVEMSERMKQYYAEHPEESERLSSVLDISWGLREAKSVRKALSKFLKRKDIKPDEFAKMNMSEDKTERNILKQFWDRMPWAKKQWSICMTKGWEIYKKQKEAEEDKKNIIPIKVYPPSMEYDIKSWLRNNGYDLNKIADFANAYARTDGKEILKDDKFKYSDNAVKDYFNEKDADFNARMYHICLLKSVSDIITSKTLDDETRYEISLFLLAGLGFNVNDGYFKEMTTEELIDIYTRSYTICAQDNKKDVIEIFDENLENAYWYVKNDNEAVAEKILKNAQRAACILMAEECLKSGIFAPKETLQKGRRYVIPDTMKNDVIDLIKQSGINITGEDEIIERTNSKDVDAIIDSYLDKNSAENVLEDACQLGMLKTVYELLSEVQNKDCPRDKRDAVYAIKHYFYNENFDDKNNIANVNPEDLYYCYMNITNFAKKINYPDIAEKFEHNLNEVYSTIKYKGLDTAIDTLFKNIQQGE